MPFNDKLDLKSIENMDEAYYKFKKILMSSHKNKLPQRSFDFPCNFVILLFKYLRFGVKTYLELPFDLYSDSICLKLREQMKRYRKNKLLVKQVGFTPK